jgi:hypothetical protein
MTRKKTDSTIDDIHQIRHEISDRFGGDVFAIAEDAARRQAAANRPVWKPKHDEPSVAPESPKARASDGQSNPATG